MGDRPCDVRSAAEQAPARPWGTLERLDGARQEAGGSVISTQVRREDGRIAKVLRRGLLDAAILERVEDLGGEGEILGSRVRLRDQRRPRHIPTGATVTESLVV